MNIQKEDLAKKKRKKIISLFIVIVMVMSAAGFMMDYAFTEKLVYNGFKFQQTEQGFMTQVDDNKITFNYYPTQLESLNVSSKAMENIKSAKMVGVSYDQSSYLVETMAQMQYYLDTSLPELFGTFVQKGLLNNIGYELPELNCKNATSSMPVIVFAEARENETEQVLYENNCLTFRANSDQELVMQTERIVYGMAGIIG